ARAALLHDDPGDRALGPPHPPHAGAPGSPGTVGPGHLPRSGRRSLVHVLWLFEPVSDLWNRARPASSPRVRRPGARAVEAPSHGARMGALRSGSPRY